MGKYSSALKLSAVFAVPLVFTGLFFFFPLGAIIHRTFSAESLIDVWSLSSTWKIVWFTFWQALASTALTLILAAPAAYVLGRLKFKGERILSALLIVPFVLPTVVVAAAMLALQDRLGLKGILNHTTWAILIAHAFFNYALVVRMVGSFWAHLDSRAEVVAQTLGANRLQAFFRITLPRLRPAVLSAAGLVFFFSFTSFGIVLILGGPTKATLDTEIWRFAAQRLEFGTAAALTLLQLIVVGTMAYLNSLTAKSVALSSAGVDTRRPARKFLRQDWGSMVLALSITIFLLVLPLGVMVYESFSPRGGGGASLASYRTLFDLGSGRFRTLFVEPAEAIWNSFLYAATATGIAVFVGVLAAYAIFHLKKRSFRILFEPLFLIPLGVSSVALGFGYLIALDSPPLDLRGSWLIVPMSHALIGMPFVIRPVLVHLRSIDERLRWSGTVLGANKWQIFRAVDFPAISTGILTGAGFAFAISLGEFGASSFLTRADRPTIPVAIFRLLGRPGSLSFGQAMALSVILMLMVGSVVVLIDRLRSTRSDIGAQII